MTDAFAIAIANLTGHRPADFNPKQGVALQPGARPAPAAIPATRATPQPQPEEKRMGIRNDLRELIRAKPGITLAEIQKKLDNQNVATSLSQMVKEGHLARDGAGKDAAYTLGEGTPARRTAKATRPPKKARRRDVHADTLPRIVRGDPIAAAIEQLRQRRDGIDQAIATLEALQ